MSPQSSFLNDLIYNQAMPILWLGTVASVSIVILAAVLILLRSRPNIRQLHDRCGVVTYHGKPVLSDWEKRAIRTLMDQLSPDLHLCPQVRLADIVNVQSIDRAAWRSAFNRIASKSVDFVVMDLRNGTSIMVIELDDRSHSRPERRDRDALVNDVLRQASIPLVRFKPSGRLDIRPHLPAVT